MNFPIPSRFDPTLVARAEAVHDTEDAHEIRRLLGIYLGLLALGDRDDAVQSRVRSTERRLRICLHDHLSRSVYLTT